MSFIIYDQAAPLHNTARRGTSHSMASQAVAAGDIDVDFLPVIYQYLRW